MTEVYDSTNDQLQRSEMTNDQPSDKTVSPLSSFLLPKLVVSRHGIFTNFDDI